MERKRERIGREMSREIRYDNGDPNEVGLKRGRESHYSEVERRRGSLGLPGGSFCTLLFFRFWTRRRNRLIIATRGNGTDGRRGRDGGAHSDIVNIRQTTCLKKKKRKKNLKHF